MNTCEFLREANAIADQLRGKGAAMSAVRPGRGSSPALCSAGNSSRICRLLRNPPKGVK